jgi:hypothetical protein
MAMNRTEEILSRIPMIGPSPDEDRYDPLWDDIDPPRYLSIEGDPISMRDWARLSEFAWEEYKRVANTWLKAEPKVSLLGFWQKHYAVWVSTVWLGLNHAWHPDMEPHIFETIAFEAKPARDSVFFDLKSPWDIYDRYSTLDQALEGHQRCVQEFSRKVVRAYA